jgi:S-DNA-T family DNA segregation ATPase FtsK/SpoIIIE
VRIPPALSAVLARRAELRSARARDRHASELVHDFEATWNRLTEFVGLSHTVMAAAGPTVVTPRLVNVDASGPHLALIVRLLPGQLPEHFTAVADQLAPALGARMVRIVPRGLHWIRVELLHEDPLDAPVVTPDTTFGHSVVDQPILIARDEADMPLAMSWVNAPHTVVQGRTRSGKSVWCYSVLGQLAGLRDVRITGSDPSGLLLGRPYDGTEHRDWQAVGTRDVAAHVEILARLVEEMDRRIEGLPPRVDKLTSFSIEQPLMVVVLEEFPGLVRLASALPTPRGETKARDQLHQMYGRLVCEGHKAGLRLLVVSQRADAGVLGGAGERGQLGLKLSFAVDDPAALPMLHGEDARALMNQHRYAPPGVALLDTPTTPTRRVRGPRLPGPDHTTDYTRYWDEIAAATARLRPAAA